MSKTIVQEYGPIYGEAVNGTVMGRPNGSVAVPSMNKIGLVINATYRYLRPYTVYGKKLLIVCDSSGNYVWSPEPNKGIEVAAESQDLASFMQTQVYTDAALTTQVAFGNYPNGNFNACDNGIGNADYDGLTDGQTVYVRAQLYAGGSPVATSDTIEVTMVVPA